MTRFVITAVFEVESGRAPLGKDVIARQWGGGHQFSYCDGRMLTLVAEVTAVDSTRAFETVLSRAEHVWEVLTGQTLPAPSTRRVQPVVPQEIKVLAGAVGRGPDRLLAEAAASRVAHLRAAVGALADLQRLGRCPRPRLDADPWQEFDDPDDEGGLAWVREPRRPGPGPGGASFAVELPPPFPPGPAQQV